MTDPSRWGLFAWQVGWVFTLRSLDLMARPDGAGAELARMAAEKQQRARTAIQRAPFRVRRVRLDIATTLEAIG